MKVITIKLLVPEYKMNLMQLADYTELEILELAEEGAKERINKSY
jgi:hypothetical protein